MAGRAGRWSDPGSPLWHRARPWPVESLGSPLLTAAAIRAAHQGAYTADRDRRWDTGVLCPAALGCKKPARYRKYWLGPATRRRGARAGQGAEQYSRKVQQPARIPEDCRAHPETLTCTDVLLWMC